MNEHTHTVTVPPASALSVGPAVLVLEDGTRYDGRAYGATGQTIGQLTVFSAATAFQETLTSPEQSGQIVLFATPHIGNTGANDEDARSERVQAAGLIVRDPARRASSYRATRTLDEDLVAAGTVGIAGIDTRAIVRRVRGAEGTRAGIFSGDALELTDDMQLALVAGTKSGE